MSDPVYTIRNYQPSDFEKYVLFHTEAEEMEPRKRDAVSEVLAKYLKRPHYSPEKDLLITEKDNGIVGCLDITPELRIRRVILNCLVHPAHLARPQVDQQQFTEVVQQADLVSDIRIEALG